MPAAATVAPAMPRAATVIAVASPVPASSVPPDFLPFSPLPLDLCVVTVVVVEAEPPAGTPVPLEPSAPPPCSPSPGVGSGSGVGSGAGSSVTVIVMFRRSEYSLYDMPGRCAAMRTYMLLSSAIGSVYFTRPSSRQGQVSLVVYQIVVPSSAESSSFVPLGTVM